MSETTFRACASVNFILYAASNFSAIERALPRSVSFVERLSCRPFSSVKQAVQNWLFGCFQREAMVRMTVRMTQSIHDGADFITRFVITEVILPEPRGWRPGFESPWGRQRKSIIGYQRLG